MNVFIKNMVCTGTKAFVFLEMKRLGLSYRKLELGEVDIEEPLTIEDVRKLDSSLRKYGLEVTYKKSKIVCRVRQAIFELISDNSTSDVDFHKYIESYTGYKYTYLNNLFTKKTGLPIEEYYFEKQYENQRETEPKWSDVFNPKWESVTPDYL